MAPFTSNGEINAYSSKDQRFSNLSVYDALLLPTLFSEIVNRSLCSEQIFVALMAIRHYINMNKK